MQAFKTLTEFYPTFTRTILQIQQKKNPIRFLSNKSKYFFLKLNLNLSEIKNGRDRCFGIILRINI